MKLENKLLIDLAKEYGTPLYVYDGDWIAKRYKQIFEVIKYPMKILYAMKANYNLGILKLLKDLGASIDTVSPGEVLLALKAGFSPEQIMFTANNIPAEEMKAVAKTGVFFNLGSLSELERYGKLFPGTKVCLRINPAVVAGAHAKIQTGGDLTKFGILMDDIEAAAKIADQYNLSVTGLHKHTGSGIKEKEKFIEAVHNLLSCARKDLFPNLEFVDFGGGLYVPYHPDDKGMDYVQFGKEIDEIMNEFAKNFGKQLQLYFEPGKYMVAESGYLVVEVNTLKDNHGRLIAGTNSGFPQLIRPVFYDAYHHIINLTNPNGEEKVFDICGNICETGDCFATDRKMPEVREGDLLAIYNAGAYCYAMGGIYNLRAMPPEVLVRDGKATLIRKRLTNEDLVNTIVSESTI